MIIVNKFLSTTRILKFKVIENDFYYWLVYSNLNHVKLILLMLIKLLD
jgi:hypothetical protein